MAPGAEKLMCSTRQEMMEAVRKGKANAAFVYYYMAQAFVNEKPNPPAMLGRME